MLRPAPYKGLRFYTTEDADIFAARGPDAGRCAQLLTKASVLMLHGRTGCGKSSFLRAALKPVLDRTPTGLWFAGEHKGFTVVRSGVNPLREIAAAVYELVQHLVDEAASDVAKRDLRRAVGDATAKDEFVETCGHDSARMVDSLLALARAAPGTPIIVVDQAEEIFTLRDKNEVRVEGSLEERANNRRLRGDLANARVAYMNLLRAVAERPLGVKFLISLRTEYKGLFEDELRRAMSAEASTLLAGFHLDDLNYNGLVSAIKAPAVLGATGAGPGVYGFRYEPGVAEEIARRLLHPDAVPMGGVLPTLQVVCTRLYEQTRRARKGDADWTIHFTDLERLGALDNQIEVYLRERLEETFRRFAADPHGDEWSGDGAPESDRTTHIDRWYQLLEKLVRLQGDGRAVTRQLSREELESYATDLRCQDLLTSGALDDLAKESVAILRNEPRDGKTLWSLGHDSLGLAIQRWGVTYKESLDPTMRMDMNSPRQSAKLTRRQLFPATELPCDFEVTVSRDLLFDHQIPFFAKARGLCDRLGVKFISDPELTIVKPGSDAVGARQWHELQGRLAGRGRDRTRRILVAAERAAFPPVPEASGWTDVAVSDLFLGNGLVGPVIEPDADGTGVKLLPLRTAAGESDDRTLSEMRARLKAQIEYLADAQAQILAYDASAKSMMRAAAMLADADSNLVDRLRFDTTRDLNYGGDDELFDRLVASGKTRSVFMVGTAYGRALASHRGYVTYFDCQDLMRIMDLQTKQRRDKDSEQVLDTRRAELFRRYRESFFHTVWQINVPSSDWRNIEHYPLVMRLAGICYFTADYIRAFPDDFVRHLYDWHAENNDEARISRETVRDMVRDCFQFLTFDENPRLLFDPDHQFEFRPTTTAGDRVSSTVREIHVELTQLRKVALDRFGEMCWELEQLERHGRNARSDDDLARAEKLRNYAWQNFRIYNYYDATRLMGHALEIVHGVVERTTKNMWSATVSSSQPKRKEFPAYPGF